MRVGEGKSCCACCALQVALALLVAVQATLLMPKNGHSKDVLTVRIGKEPALTDSYLACCVPVEECMLESLREGQRPA